MIDPSLPSDIGRGVVKTDSDPHQFGTLTNWTVDWCHVRLAGENFSRPEFRENLEWEDEYLARYR